MTFPRRTFRPSVPRTEAILTEPVPANDRRIRLLLDDGTVVHMKSMDRYLYWKARFPNARLISGPDLLEAAANESVEKGEPPAP